ncbi:MAG: serine protease [Patescibacteria group bacterium]|nr:serine protease [Patescibacteria group bacterium]
MQAQTVLGEATTFSENQKSLLVAKPAVVQVTNITTGNMILQASIANELNAPQLTGKSYEFVVGLSGSGFFITPDGYLITNGHVAKPEEDLVAYYAIVQNAEFMLKDAIYYVLETNYGYSPTEAELENAYQYALVNTYSGSYDVMVDQFYSIDYKGGNMVIDGLKNNAYIQTGSVSGTQKLVKEYGKAASLIDTSYEGDFNSKDLALLKVDGSNFPTIELGSFGNVQIGKEVFAIGYPALVESGTGVFTDTQSQLEPSITKGIISAKKTLVDGTEAFQTDAGITHGNSGGPVVDTEGKVIGVATWSFGDNPGGESFNFLISVEQIQALLSRNNITVSESISTSNWSEALDLFSEKCYTKAKAKFEDTKTLYADNVDIDDFISQCQTAIENGEDACQSKIGNWGYIAGGVCCVLLLIALIVILLLVFVVKKRKKTEQVEQKTGKA